MENIDWKNLPFQYIKTDYNVRCYWRNGQWGHLEISSSEFINLHMAATSLHYGQEAFEGLKAYRTKEGRILVFRAEENAKRMAHSADGVLMAAPPIDVFIKAVKKVVALNERFVPPYGTGASLYIRPLLIGSGPEVGVKPSSEYLLMVFVTPVGPYFKEGFKPLDLLIFRDADRAAPLGTGKYKVGGNYAASLASLKKAKELGFSTTLYLDPKEKRYIDEAGPANFFAIRGNTYITPKSSSILPSITNLSLMDLAKNMGMDVEVRPIEVDELETFDEVGACGTAAVITPIHKIEDQDKNKTYVFGDRNNPGPISTKFYKKIVAIQTGDEPDIFNWMTEITPGDKNF